jgi:hypothetical protein
VLDRFNRNLTSAGWTDLPDDERWSLRSTPQLLDSPALPRLDPSDLTTFVRERISGVQYAIDVTGLVPTVTPPPFLNHFRLP